MRVRALRRYPVKAMGGEGLDSVTVDSRGLAGDRWFAVVDEDGRFAAGKDTDRFRRRDPVFGFAARTEGERVTVVRGSARWRAGDAALDDVLSEAMGTPVRVLPEGSAPHFDDAPVSLVGTASLEWCRAHLGADARQRRIRANLLVETDEPFVEETWLGSRITVGQLGFGVSKQITRCRVVDLAQDGVSTTTGLLKALAARDVKLGVYAVPQAAGSIAVGDPVTVS
ncbi:MAG: MOSC domain-containing protein [Marmoricola sp.]